MSVPSAPEAPADAPATTAGRRSTRRLVVVAALVVVALAAGITGLVALLGDRDERAAAQAELDAATAHLDDVRGELLVWIDNGAVNVSHLAGVVDEEPRLELAALVEEAEQIDTTAPSEGTLEERTAATEALSAEMQTTIDELTAAHTAILVAKYDWDLRVEVTRYEGALSALAPSLAAADAALAAGTGTPGARDAVTAAVTAAVALRDAPFDAEDVDVVIAVAGDLIAARQQVDAAVAALG